MGHQPRRPGAAAAAPAAPRIPGCGGPGEGHGPRHPRPHPRQGRGSARRGKGDPCDPAGFPHYVVCFAPSNLPDFSGVSFFCLNLTLANDMVDRHQPTGHQTLGIGGADLRKRPSRPSTFPSPKSSLYGPRPAGARARQGVTGFDLVVGRGYVSVVLTSSTADFFCKEYT